MGNFREKADDEPVKAFNPFFVEVVAFHAQDYFIVHFYPVLSFFVHSLKDS